MYRRKWKQIVNWFQRASQADKNGKVSLSVHSDYYVKGERGSTIAANEGALRGLERLEFIYDLVIRKDESVSFRFRDELVRYWLRDQGSVLEVYVWKNCHDAGIFHDVCCSTVVEWDKRETGERITNEIDVVAVEDKSTPVFISCKTCAVDTDAINELAILRDRFGGDGAKAFIVTTESCRAITRRRAKALKMDIITLDDLRSADLAELIRTMIQ